jgi:ketosteroid isomerase-like protein
MSAAAPAAAGGGLSMVTKKIVLVLALIVLFPMTSHADVSVPDSRRMAYLNRFYEQFAHEQALPIAFMLPKEMTWNHTGYRTEVIPFAGDYNGRAEILEYFRNYFSVIRVRHYQFQYKLSDGDHVSWHFRLIADVPMTGKTFDQEFIHVWRFNADGAPVECRSYYDTQIETEAFSLGGRTYVADLKDPNRDDDIKSTPYDVDGLVETIYDRFYGGDIGGALALLADDAAIYFKGAGYPFAGTYIGKDAILQFIYNLAGTALAYDIHRFQVTEGDHTDVILFENWQVYSTGKSFHVHTVNSWRVNDAGMLMGFYNTPDTDEVAQAYVPD